MIGDIWNVIKGVGKGALDGLLGGGGGGDWDWKKALGQTALGVGGTYLGNKALGDGYREPWDGFLDQRKDLAEYVIQKSKEDLPYVPGFAPKRAGLTGAEDIVKALAMANLEQGYSGKGMENYKPLDLSAYGVESNTPGTFEKPDFNAIMEAALAAAAKSTGAAMNPGQPPPEEPPPQQPPPEQPRAAPTTQEEAAEYLTDYKDKLQNDGAFGFRTDRPAPHVQHDSGFRPKTLTLQDEIGMGVDHDKLEAKYGAGVVNDHLQSRGLPPTPSNSPYRGKY